MWHFIHGFIASVYFYLVLNSFNISCLQCIVHSLLQLTALLKRRSVSSLVDLTTTTLFTVNK